MSISTRALLQSITVAQSKCDLLHSTGCRSATARQVSRAVQCKSIAGGRFRTRWGASSKHRCFPEEPTQGGDKDILQVVSADQGGQETDPTENQVSELNGASEQAKSKEKSATEEIVRKQQSGQEFEPLKPKLIFPQVDARE